MDKEQRELISAARNKVRVAEKLLEDDEIPDAVSRAYYGMFHAARAALLSEESRPRTHQGVVSELGKLFRDRIDRELISAFSQIQSLREDADYEPYFGIEPERAVEVVDTAKRFLAAVIAVLDDK